MMSNEVGCVKIVRVFLLTKNLFIMIYKFKKDDVDFEVELIQDLDNGKVLSEHVVLSVSDFDTNEWNSIHLNKKDVYHLIGALHLLHKEMK